MDAPSSIVFDYQSLSKFIEMFTPTCTGLCRASGFQKGCPSGTIPFKQCGKKLSLKVEQIFGLACQLSLSCGNASHPSFTTWTSERSVSKESERDNGHYSANTRLVLAALDGDLCFEKLNSFCEILRINCSSRKTFDVIREDIVDVTQKVSNCSV